MAEQYYVVADIEMQTGALAGMIIKGGWKVPYPSEAIAMKALRGAQKCVQNATYIKPPAGGAYVMVGEPKIEVRAKYLDHPEVGDF
jgi:hypothetical protein